MSAHPVPMLLDWLGQLLKDHALIEQQREESGYDPDYDTGDPPDCFDPTAWEIALAAVKDSLPDESVSEDELRSVLAVRNYERRAKQVLGDKLQPSTRHEEQNKTLSRLEGIGFLQALVDRLREESWRKPHQKHAAWLAEFCERVDPQAKNATQFAPSAASEPADEKPRIGSDEANIRAREALKGKPPKGKKRWTTRTLAKAIGFKRVDLLPAWQAYAAEHGISRQAQGIGGRAVSLTGGVLANAGRRDDQLERVQNGLPNDADVEAAITSPKEQDPDAANEVVRRLIREQQADARSRRVRV